jgi:hypothetical protein
VESEHPPPSDGLVPMEATSSDSPISPGGHTALASISHELKTPLQGIIGFADLLANGVFGPVSERQIEALDRIKSTAWQLAATIEEFTRPSSASLDRSGDTVDPPPSIPPHP